ncbi:ATP-binding protein [Pedobacter aquatilis]|uniref:sensor histidine kinase n=1 Tax=Pedobacter aquatilis TaxID=351343 RepID=UPI0025B45A48|nr:ATP-binding protein [Pedobacter aquatilis]MDN3588489.1 ATP-binding protein [Pedobacter aquatilis]
MTLAKNRPAFLFDAETLYENAPCGYCSFLANGQIIRMNRTFAVWLGIADAEEAESKLNLKDFLTKAGKIYYEIIFSPMIQMQDSAKELSFEICRKDGSKFPVLISASVMRIESYSELIVNAIVVDVSDRKKYEKELLQAKQVAETEAKKVAFLSDFSPELIWSADGDGIINQVNKRFTDYFNIKNDDLSGAVILERVHPEDKLLAIKAWLKAIKETSKLHLQIRIANKQGIYHWFVVRAEAFKDLSGKVDRWIGSCNDIDTHMLVIEKRDEFLNIAGHELKTPMTSLKGALQLMDRMKTGITNPVILKLIGQSNQNVEKIIRLFNELLISGKQDDGILQLQKSNFWVNELLENCCMHIRLAETHELIYIGEKGIKAYADKSRIEQVVVNFVNNAVKYAPESKSIILDVQEESNDIRVIVSDKGPGIPSEKQQYLFERYYRASVDAHTAGLGLGLYICADIVKRHGGKIGVDSIPGSGSSFWFTIPKALQPE